MKSRKTQCNKGSFLLKVQQQQQSKNQAGFWMCTASAEGTRRLRKESWGAILTMKNYQKKGHHYYFCCYWFATLQLSPTLCQFIDSLQLIWFFLIFQFLIPLKKKTRKNEQLIIKVTTTWCHYSVLKLEGRSCWSKGNYKELSRLEKML